MSKSPILLGSRHHSKAVMLRNKHSEICSRHLLLRRKEDISSIAAVGSAVLPTLKWKMFQSRARKVHLKGASFALMVDWSFLET